MTIQCDLLGWPEDGPTLRLAHREFAYAGKFVMSSTGKAVARAPAEVTDGEDPGEADTPDGEGSAEGDGPVEGEGYAEGVLAAVAFNEDRTDPGTLWLRYVTVRADRRGEGIGPRLVGFVVARARERGYERVRIAVNNPYAYQALYRAGFRYTGRETGIAELVLERGLTRAGEDPGGDEDPGVGDDSVGDGNPGVDEDPGQEGERGASDDPDPERYRAGLAAFAERDLDADQRAFVENKREAGPPDRRAEDAGGR